MRKIICGILIGCVCLSVVACGGQTSSTTSSVSTSDTTSKSEVTETDKPKEESSVTEIKALSPEELETAVEADVNDTLTALNSGYESLIAEVGTYEKYGENVDKIDAFYKEIVAATTALCIRLREYSAGYSEYILSSGQNFKEQYENLEELYDIIYEDAGDEIYDEIYDGILDNMYEFFYEDIMDEGYEIDAYKKWSDLKSEEYDMWSDCKSDVYDEYSDMKSDIYDLYSDLRSETYDGDEERARQKLDKFISKMEKLQTE